MPYGWLGAADERDPVPDRQLDGDDALIGGDLVVQLRDLPRALVLRVEHAAAPERVVDRDQTALGEPRQYGFVVRVVAFLVGVDEDEIELALEVRDRLRRRAQMEPDLRPVRAAVEVTLGDLGVLRLDV